MHVIDDNCYKPDDLKYVSPLRRFMDTSACYIQWILFSSQQQL